MDLHLRGKRVTITGASKGIGAAAAEAFAEEGCDLNLVARDETLLEALSKKLTTAHGIDVRVFPCDLRDTAALRATAEAIGDTDVLVNNAGDIPGGSVDKFDTETLRHVWGLKVFGYVEMTRLVYAKMKARKRGVIVNDIGAAGERFDAEYIAGSTGNAALMAFTRALGGRSIADGIRVVGINPGPVATDRIVSLLKTRARERLGDESRYTELMQRFPMGRAAHPREIADLMAFLASDRSGYTSGVIVTVDGGICASGGAF